MIYLSNFDNIEMQRSATQYITKELKNWLISKSKSPRRFYIGLSGTIISDNNKIYGSGLTKYISDKRNLIEQFIGETFKKI